MLYILHIDCSHLHMCLAQYRKNAHSPKSFLLTILKKKSYNFENVFQEMRIANPLLLIRISLVNVKIGTIAHSREQYVNASDRQSVHVQILGEIVK